MLRCHGVGSAGQGGLGDHAVRARDPNPQYNPDMKSILHSAARQWEQLLPKLCDLEEPLTRLGQTLMDCWARRGKVLIAGNGGSAADAMHLAEELVVRFKKNRRALAAIALCDPTVLTCAGNDFSYDQVFARQIEALGNPGDVFIAFSTSGNSKNIILAIQQAKAQQLRTAALLGHDGGQCRGLADIEMIVPSDDSARVQEAHQMLFHSLCQWIDEQPLR